MKYPCLVSKKYCKTPIHIEIHSEDTDRFGQPLTLFSADLMCNYQSTGKTVLTAQKQLVQLTAQAFFVGDICPNIPEITKGTVIVNGISRDIFSGTKARNPDGTVNYVRLDIV